MVLKAVKTKIKKPKDFLLSEEVYTVHSYEEYVGQSLYSSSVNKLNATTIEMPI